MSRLSLKEFVQVRAIKNHNVHFASNIPLWYLCSSFGQPTDAAAWNTDDNPVIINGYKINMRKLVEWCRQRRMSAIQQKLGDKKVKMTIPGTARRLQVGEYSDLIQCLKLNFKGEFLSHCISCAGQISYGINENMSEICVSCFHAVFINKEISLFERLQNTIKFNQYCKNDEARAFHFFVDICDYYTNFKFVHARNKLKENNIKMSDE